MWPLFTANPSIIAIATADGRKFDNTLSAVRLSGAVLSSLASTPLAALSAEAAATSSAADIPYWENTANSFKVRLPGRLQTAAPVMVTHQGYTLGFRHKTPMPRRRPCLPSPSRRL